jgi:trimeric autotransporter adhesin
VALNFPINPGIGSIHTDSTSGFSYEWNGTVWKSYSAASSSSIKIIDDISSGFNGIGTIFALSSNSVPLSPKNAASLLINLGGVIQDPFDDYTVGGSNIIFSTAPDSILTFSGIQYGDAIPVTTVTIPDGTVTEGNFTVIGRLNVGTGITANPSGVNVTGVVTATSFVGDGSGLTGAGSTVADDTSTNQTFYPLFTQATSGTVTATKVSTTKLTYNPSLGKLEATIVNSTSDENLKKDIHTIENALDKVKQLRGVDFNWKDNDQKSIGVVAQEVQKVFPELVFDDGENLSVNYSGLIGVLIESIKELSSKIDNK